MSSKLKSILTDGHKANEIRLVVKIGDIRQPLDADNCKAIQDNTARLLDFTNIAFTPGEDNKPPYDVENKVLNAKNQMFVCYKSLKVVLVQYIGR